MQSPVPTIIFDHTMRKSVFSAAVAIVFASSSLLAQGNSGKSGNPGGGNSVDLDDNAGTCDISQVVAFFGTTNYGAVACFGTYQGNTNNATPSIGDFLESQYSTETFDFLGKTESPTWGGVLNQYGNDVKSGELTFISGTTVSGYSGLALKYGNFFDIWVFNTPTTLDGFRITSDLDFGLSPAEVYGVRETPPDFFEVPEPASIVLVASGMLLMAGVARRRGHPKN